MMTEHDGSGLVCSCPACNRERSSAVLLGDLLQRLRFGAPPATGSAARLPSYPRHPLAGLLQWGARRWCSSQYEYVRASVLLARADRVARGPGMVAFWRRAVLTRDQYPHQHEDLRRAALIRAAVRTPQPWKKTDA